jgi:hypothetical protein
MFNYINENNQIKIEIQDNFRMKIDKIINQERDDDIDHYLANYNLMKDQNICYNHDVYYNHDVCYTCFNIFGRCL